MKITILAVGRLKENYWKEAVREYIKRLAPYAKVEVLEVQDEKTPENASRLQEEQILQKEGERLLARLPENAQTIALAIDGTAYSSEELAGEIEKLQVYGTSHIVFIIGGSLGLDRRVLDRACRKLSFSKLTFPHQMMRVILLEQIYRSFRIIHREPYHK